MAYNILCKGNLQDNYFMIKGITTGAYISLGIVFGVLSLVYYIVIWTDASRSKEKFD
jgi:hypothetical protein